jgi:predicted esterase
MRTSVAALIVLLLAPFAVAGWEEDLAALIAADEADRPTLLEKVAAASPDTSAVIGKLRGITFAEAPKGKMFLRKTMCRDGVERPWVLLAPEGIDPAKPAPLLVILHGGVHRADLVEKPLESAENKLLTNACRERGWLAIYPFGQIGAAWWDDVGMANIENLIRTVKRERNVDDDRVAMVGFSDGGSAGFLHAMVKPTDYAAFLALNGHMGVGAIDAGRDTYAPNFANTPVFATTTFGDELYPSAKMRKTIEMARKAGGRIFYRERAGRHDGDHLKPLIPVMVEFLERHRRDPFPTRIVWEASSRQFGRCRWLEVTDLRIGEKAPWHVEHNVHLVDERVSIGFNLAKHEGDGLKVGGVVDDSFAKKNGLKVDDIVIGMNGQVVKKIEDLNAAKSKVMRGDPVTLKILRGGKEMTLAGNLPEISRYMVFPRKNLSGMVRAAYAANVFTVETSCVARFRIFVYPSMVNLDEPVTVLVNGRQVHSAKVAPDVRFLLESFLADRDRRALPVAEISVEVPVVAGAGGR